VSPIVGSCRGRWLAGDRSGDDFGGGESFVPSSRAANGPALSRSRDCHSRLTLARTQVGMTHCVGFRRDPRHNYLLKHSLPRSLQPSFAIAHAGCSETYSPILGEMVGSCRRRRSGHDLLVGGKNAGGWAIAPNGAEALTAIQIPSGAFPRFAPLRDSP